MVQPVLDEPCFYIPAGVVLISSTINMLLGKSQIWTYADQSRTGFLSRQEFYNALKLVTVAQNRELTPEIVKAALFTPASAKIPAPQINLAAIPGPQPINTFSSAVPPVSGATPTAAQTFGVRVQQGLPAQQSYVRPPRPSNPSPGFHSQPNVSGQGMLVGSTIAASRPPTSTDLLAGRNGGSQAGTSSQAPNTSVSSRSQDAFALAVSTPSAQQTQQATTSSVRPDLSKSNDATLSHGNPPDAKGPKIVSVAGNGFPSDSLFGDVFSVASVQPRQSSATTISSASSLAVSSATDRASTGSQPPVKVPVQSSAANPSAARNSLPGQSQHSWPRITQSDYQKYSKVFMAVDTDRDGKITGTEARSLFLSWKLPRDEKSEKSRGWSFIAVEGGLVKGKRNGNKEKAR
ncbi:hypothetical protein K7X08_017337 [Anisodus acutangulus]|uniref:EF-hand domain-containing protein n=1 Tax=Anisodus acutangulus TaxID=402998 RepID=A0A9Q1R695_9SOLA|nr:hypothetical protein K7X08_017337 [Anisodus acutangulus]